jgi:methylmalonyl-CoA/ethylmalonyl-CoA epimerase
MTLDHIGIVVNSLEEGILQWTEIFGYNQMTEQVINTLQKIKVVFMSKENSLQVKLIEPLNENSPIYSFAKKGGGLHHLCFRTQNLDSTLSQLKNKRNEIRVIVHPQPGEAFENQSIAFAMVKNNLNIEFIDTEKRAKMLI